RHRWRGPKIAGTRRLFRDNDTRALVAKLFPRESQTVVRSSAATQWPNNFPDYRSIAVRSTTRS
ncbi:MAG: hypothetical protein ACK5PZ_17710, partial [Pirellula sp.]